jgi:hypothetical protein
LTEAGINRVVAARTVRITHTSRGVELYFPPLRMPEIALPLAMFGIVAVTLPAVSVAALLPSLAGASGLLSAVLLATFVLPFGAFGAAFVLLAFYMLANALLVRVNSELIETSRLLFGVVLRRHRITRSSLTAIEAQIASRYQSLFSADPVYQLVARGASEGPRVVVAETLVGEAMMQQVKALIEHPQTRA